MIYMKHKTLGNGHFENDRLLELESQGWVWFPHGDTMTRPEFAPATATEPVVSSSSTPTPTAGAPEVKRGPGRPRK